jgi:hypothetical protein
MNFMNQLCKILVSLSQESHTVHKNRQISQAKNKSKRPMNKGTEEHLFHVQSRMNLIEKRLQEFFSG